MAELNLSSRERAANDNFIGRLPPLAPGMPVPAGLRSRIEHTIEQLLEVLDAADGDPDLEEGDPSGQCDEDEINTGWQWASLHAGPGCFISDNDHEPYEACTRYG